MSVIESIRGLLGNLDSGLKNLRKALASLEERLAALDREKSQLLGAPAPLADVLRSIEALVGETGDRWRATHGPALLLAAGQITQPGGPNTPPDHLVVSRAAFPPGLQGLVTIEALCALAPDLVLTGLRRAVADTPYEDAGPLATRSARLKAITKERDKLRREHATLVDRVNAYGLAMEHHPDERARRAAVAAEHQAAARDAAVNRRFYERHPDERPAPLAHAEEL